jgi:putative ABC transport system permease protein
MDMSHLIRWVRRLVNTVRPGRAEAGLERELASHLALLEDEYERRGLSREAARRAARLALGGIEQTKERHRDARAFRWIDNVARDAVYATRMLRRHPVGTVTAVLSLAIAIGLNAAVFSVVDWVLLRPLPYPAAHELAHVLTTERASPAGPGGLTHAEFDALSGARGLRAAAAFTNTTRVLAGPGVEPVHVMVGRVAGDLFGTLGVDALIGRGFTAEEMTSGLPVVVLGDDLWQRSFGGGPAVTGQAISIDGVPHTVVGVMPAARGYPRDADIWRPFTRAERTSDDRELSALVRLGGGVTIRDATAEIASRVGGASDGTRVAWAEPMHRTDVIDVRTPLQALFAAAMLTLLVACANVAALVGARGADRAGEIAVRGALGATRTRLFTQLVTESCMLAVIGGALGLLLGRWTLDALVSMAPVALPRLSEISLDGRVLGLGVAATLLTGFAVGVAPALRLSRASVSSAANQLARHRTSSQHHARRALVLAQVAAAVVLTTGAGLLLRSLHYLVTQDQGFTADRLISVRVFPPRSYNGDVTQLFRDLAASADAVPGVDAVTWALRLPTQVGGLRPTVAVAGEREVRAIWRPVEPAFFATVGLRVTEGRGFEVSDKSGAPAVAIVNRAFVQEVLGGRSPLAMQLTSSFSDRSSTIVGVAADITPAGEPDRPAVYVPVEQSPIGEGHLLVRARIDPQSVMPALASRLRQTAPALPFDRVARVAAILEESRAVTRFLSQLAGMFAALALSLSMIGVYSLTAGEVAGRWREIAIRLALGASRREALWTVVRPCIIVLGAGAGIGLAGALGMGRALRSLLHGVAATDLRTLAAAALLLGVIGLIAAVAAAIGVLRAEPAATLRGE